MKTKKPIKRSRNGLAVPKVHLEFIHPTAAEVGIAGTFNDWRPGATPMVHLGQGRWVKELALPPGMYEYRVVVDGEWIPDPLAKETAPNGLGGLNSILRVEVRG